MTIEEIMNSLERLKDLTNEAGKLTVELVLAEMRGLKAKEDGLQPSVEAPAEPIKSAVEVETGRETLKKTPLEPTVKSHGKRSKAT